MKHQFDTYYQVENDFAKSNPNFLKEMFGATDLMPLWIADMDFKVAPPITEELQRLVDRGIYAYEFNTNKVVKAISDWNLKRHNLSLHRKRFIQVSGVLTGIAVLIRTLTKEGDGILVQTPVYHQFYKAITASNRKIIKSPLQIVEGQYRMNFDAIEQQLKVGNVKMILLCNPHNPIGRVWKKEELQQLIMLANAYDVTIISDEIHADIVYGNARFTSIASFSNSEHHIAILGSPAKTFGMQSIANGFLYIPNEKVYDLVKSEVSALYLDHGNAFSAYATVAAYTKGEAWLDALVMYLEKTLQWIKDFLQKEIPQIKMLAPEGTYQVWLDFSGLQLSDDDLQDLLVHKAKLALAPGNWFDKDHKQYMRMNFASPFPKIQEAFTQLKNAIAT